MMLLDAHGNVVGSVEDPPEDVKIYKQVVEECAGLLNIVGTYIPSDVVVKLREKLRDFDDLQFRMDGLEK